MSQIDQAFIQAYGAPGESASGYGSPSPTIPLPTSPLPTSPLPTSSPQLHAHPALSQPGPQQFIPMTAEPLPAPHFQAPAASDPYAETAALQVAAASIDPIAANSDTRQRRPLSSFAAPDQPATTTFQPVFEVDAFRWPTVTDELLARHQDLLAPVAGQLLTASEEGRTMVGIVGARPGVGCTTSHICLARMIAATGKKVAIVDANFARGDLARTLGLEFDTGWEDALAGRAPLAECVVYSLADRIALLPLGGPCADANELLAGIQTSITAGVLRYHYDVVLVDLGAAAHAPQAMAAQAILAQCRLDASIVIADTSTHDSRAADGVDQLLSVFGPTCLGLIGNNARAA